MSRIVRPFYCLCMSVPIVHLVPLLTDKVYKRERVSMLMVLMFSGIFDDQEASLVLVDSSWLH